MTVRVKLPGGTLKLKKLRELRTEERERKVPMLRLGRYYLIWRRRNRALGDGAAGH